MVGAIILLVTAQALMIYSYLLIENTRELQNAETYLISAFFQVAILVALALLTT